MPQEQKKRSSNEFIGRSRGGLSTKIHCLVNEYGKPLAFDLTAGQASDVKRAEKLLEGKKYKCVIADRGYDALYLRKSIENTGAEVVIPSRSLRTKPFPYNKDKYTKRNQIERFFNKLKHFRGIATRYIKTGAYFLQAIFFASFIVSSRSDDNT